MKDGSYTVIDRSGPEYKRQIQKFGQKLDEKDARIRTLENKCSMKDRTISEMGQEMSRLEKTIRKLSRKNKKLQKINENQARKLDFYENPNVRMNQAFVTIRSCT